ncbi:MAG: hypothetical protein JJU11_06900 [Candidatus Sumerlaeia bacterium]|nr:hypothetical protein [Candidatus Sumerlaeia bacterium]
MRFRGLTILAIAGLMAAGGISQLAQAQTFSLENVTAEAGSTVDVQLFVSGGPTDTSALNFTVRFDPEQVTGISGVRGTAPGITNNYIYDQNTPSSSEYRAVLYPDDNTIAPFSTSGNAHVATLSVNLSSSLSDGEDVILTLANTFDVDEITGLIGLSNSQGDSIVPGGAAPNQGRPNAVNGTITITGTGPLLDVDFTGREEIPDGFGFAEVIIPFNPEAESRLGGQQTGSGYRVTVNDRNPNPGRIADTLFGQVGLLGNIVPDAGSMLLTSFDFSSNAPEPINSPYVRMNLRAQNNAYAVVVEIDETDDEAPFLLSSNNEVKTQQSATYVPGFVIDPIEFGGQTLEGFAVGFDVLNVHTPGARERAANGTYVDLRRIDIQQLEVPSEGTEVYNETFGPENTGGLTGVIVEPVTNPVATGFTSQEGGLVVGFEWLPEEERTADIADALNFPLGWWSGRLNDFQIQSNKLYRIDVNVATDAADTQFAHIFRIRAIAARGNEAVAGDYISVTSVVPDTQQVAARPTADGRTYTTIVKFPEEAVGQSMYFGLDVFSADTRTHGSIIFKNVTITELDMP